MFALLLFPDAASHAVRSGLLLCGTTVIPALFPFLVLSKILIGILPRRTANWMNRVMENGFGVSGACFAAFAISFLGSYPIGASAVIGLYVSGTISRQDAERALRFCNNSGPGFFIGIVGGVIFRSTTAGILLYLCHIFSAILCGLFCAEPKNHTQIRRIGQKEIPFSELILSGIGDTCGVLLQLCGMIVAFSLISTYLRLLNLPALPEIVEALLLGTLELTTGILHLSGSASSFAAAAFIMSWGGLCVHMQAKNLWVKAGLRVKGYYSAKLMQGFLSALFALCIINPTPLYISISAFFALICIIFPYFRKKYSGNLRRHTV